MITTEQLHEVFAAHVAAKKGRTAALCAIRDLTTREMLREIEAVEETNEGIREHSVIPHLTGIDLGAVRERDKQIAKYVGAQLAVALEIEVQKLGADSCDGKIPIESVLEIFSKINIG